MILLPYRGMVLVYDLRRDQRRRQELLSRIEDQWQAYLLGQHPVTVSEGQIVELFFAPYEGEHMFRLDDRGRMTAWVRQGENSWYVVGRQARVEQVVFEVPYPIGKMPVVTRIWIGCEAQGHALGQTVGNQ